jgi:uncharacterized protein
MPDDSTTARRTSAGESDERSVATLESTTVESTSLVDVDLHLPVAGTLSEVFAYMPAAWRRRLEYIGHVPFAASPLHYTYLRGAQVVGVDDRLMLESEPSVDLAIAQRAAVDGSGAEIAQVLPTVAVMHSLPSRYYGIGPTLTSAFNDYMLEQCIVDPRLRYAPAVFPHEIDSAVAEVNRLAADGRVCSVWLPSTPSRFGERKYDPLYRAAVEAGLPVVGHPAGAGVARTAEMRLEGAMNAPLTAWSELTSLVARGTFERFPELQVMLLECGFAWLDLCVRRMETAWLTGTSAGARFRSSPAEIVREHVRTSVSPAGDGRTSEEEWASVSEASFPFADVLVYSGGGRAGSPHPLTGWPDPERSKILAANALAVLRIQH